MTASRRGLLGLIAAVPLAPLVDFAAALEMARPATFTLVSFAVSQFSTDASLAEIVEELNRSNDLFVDMQWTEAGPHDVHTFRVRLPQPIYGSIGA